MEATIHIRELPAQHPCQYIILILGISESWLKSYITDAQIHIKDYVPIRSDRSIRKGGGAILYIHEKIPISDEDHFDDITLQKKICFES